MKTECNGVERIIIEKNGRWYGIEREAYTKDRLVSLKSKQAAKEWIEAVHDSCDCD